MPKMSYANLTRNQSPFNDTVSDSNDSAAMLPFQLPPQDYFSLPILVPLSVVIVVVNSIVFLLFAVRKPLRTPANYLLLSLAVADFITGAVNVPLIICVMVPVSYHLMKYLVHAMTVFVKLTAILTSYHILAVTVEKYLAIVKPLKHHIANPKKAFTVIIAIWFVSCLIAVAPALWELTLAPEEELTKLELLLGHDVFCFVAVFLVPYSIITYSQTVMFKAVSRSKKKTLLRRSTVSTGKPSSKWSNERKCLVIFAVMAGMFALCWLPWFLLTSLATLSVISPASVTTDILVNQDVYMSFLIIRLLTSITNPLLYTFFKRDFMVALKIVVCRKDPRLARSSTRQQTSCTNITQKNRIVQNITCNGATTSKMPKFRKLRNGSDSPTSEETTAFSVTCL